MSSGKVVLGLLAGLSAGALLGILLAPDKGSVTRKKIVDKGDDLVDAIKNKFDEFMESITGQVKEAKENMAGAMTPPDATNPQAAKSGG